MAQTWHRHGTDMAQKENIWTGYWGFIYNAFDGENHQSKVPVKFSDHRYLHQSWNIPTKPGKWPHWLCVRYTSSSTLLLLVWLTPPPCLNLSSNKRNFHWDMTHQSCHNLWLIQIVWFRFRNLDYISEFESSRDFSISTEEFPSIGINWN